MEELLNPFNDRMQAHPHYGYLIAAVILAFWLLGVILGWKWTYESSTWKENTLREMLGEKGYRIGVGVLLAIALYCALSLFVHADCKAAEAAEPTTTGYQVLETLNYQMESDSLTTDIPSQTEACRGVHTYSIRPFFEALARTLDGNPGTAKVSAYHNLHRYLALPDSLPNDTAQQTYAVTLDELSLKSYTPEVDFCLNHLQGKGFIPVDIISEAPVQCLTRWNGRKLFILWCDLSVDGQRIIRLAETYGILSR